MQTLAFNLPEGDPGTALTIQKMSALIDQGKSSAAIHAAAQSILNSYRVPAYAWERQARAIYDWVLRHVTFTPDVVGKESVQGAEWTLTYRRGDCDCIAVLMCSLLETIGMRCRLMTVAADPRDPQQFSHVYPQVSINGKWTSVDVARRHPAFGLSPRRYFRKRAWSVHSDDYRDMAGATMRGALGVLPMPMGAPLRVRSAQQPLYTPPPAPQRRRRNYFQGLGQDDGVDWTTIGQAIQAGTTGAANIIAATRANPYNLVPTTYAPIGSSGGAVQQQRIPMTSQAAAAGSFLGLSTSTLLLLALLGVGVVVVANR